MTREDSVILLPENKFSAITIIFRRSVDANIIRCNLSAICQYSKRSLVDYACPSSINNQIRVIFAVDAYKLPAA